MTGVIELTPRAFQPVQWRPRLMVAIDALGSDAGAQLVLRDLGPALAGCYPEARCRFAAAGGQSALRRSLVNFRGYELVDAVAEITWPIGMQIEDVNWSLVALGSIVTGAATIRTLIAGPVATLLDGCAPNFMLMTGTRIPGVSIADFRNWWLHQHAPLVEAHCYPMVGYEQVHADRALSERLCGELGVAFRAVDAADSVYLDDTDAFFAQISLPEVSDLLRKDEAVFSDITAGGLGMVGLVLFDSDDLNALPGRSNC